MSHVREVERPSHDNPQFRHQENMMMTTITTTDATDALDRPDWLSQQRWPFAIRRFEHTSPGGEPLAIHYTDEGEGPALVFVHAGMWSFIWRDTIAELRSDFRCITLDFPGAGLSAGKPADVDFETFPSLVNALLDHLSVVAATCVVHDLGGAVGVVAAARRPERVDGLVVTNSFAWPADRRALRVMLRVMGSRTATGLLGTMRVIPRASRSKSGVGRHYDRADRAAFFGPYRARTFSRNLHRAMRSARRSTTMFEHAADALESDLAHLPVLTVFGEKNDPFGFADRWQALFPGASAWTVAGGNHFPMCDDPAGYTRHLRDWHARCV
jgi:haloalkane dehalogenase